MHIARRVMVVAAALCAFSASSAGAAMVDVKVNPKKPIVDDSVTVSFKVKKRLASGWHYEVLLLAPRGYDCASFVHKVSKRRPAKGKVMSFQLSSYDDELNGGGEFCQGKASAMISAVPDEELTWDPEDERESRGKLVALGEWRFHAKP